MTDTSEAMRPRRNVLVGMPTRDPRLSTGTFMSMVESIYECGNAGIALSPFSWSGDPLISHARNVIFSTFLNRTDCTDLVFIDDDVSWEPGTLLKLISHPADLVAGLYRHKRDPESYPFNLLDPDLGKLQQDRNTGLILVADVPFGFTRISRACAEKMWEAAKDKPFRHQSAPDLDCRLVFDVEYRDGQYFGEDYYFCRNWREIGGQVWVDPSLVLTHHGFKDYKGNVGAWLRRGCRPEAVNDPETIRNAFRDVVEALRPAVEQQAAA